LLFLYAERLGTEKADLGALDPDRLETDFYFQLIKDAVRVRNYARWEILVDHFDYNCDFRSATNEAHIRANDPRLQKSLRLGFIHFFQQNLAMFQRMEHKLPVLAGITGRLVRICLRWPFVRMFQPLGKQTRTFIARGQRFEGKQAIT